jgi:hypothetical protein
MAPSRRIVVGVDTHADTHTAAICDELGRLVEFATFPADRSGYRRLLQWARRHGTIDAFGVESTGAYGAGLTRFLVDHDERVIEVNRVNRQHRRRRGKSDPFDAEAAARAVLSGEATAIPRQRCAQVEAVRVLRIARRSAVHAKTKAANQIRDLIVTAPDDIRAELAGLSTEQRVRHAARWRPTAAVDARTATRAAIHRLAKRWIALHDEARELEQQIRQLLETLVPSLLAEQGVSTHVAAALVVAVGENPQRLRSEASFAALCGTNPVPASSGKNNRHRLNRGGDRQANSALHTVVLIRSQRCDETRRYIERRTNQGHTQRETWRCLKRALARRFHHLLVNDLAHALT